MIKTETETDATQKREADFYDLLAEEMDRRFVFYPLPTLNTDQTEPKPHHNPTID